MGATVPIGQYVPDEHTTCDVVLLQKLPGRQELFTIEPAGQ
jgi:hypothetical protein